jgi:3-oxoacyl-[acyl-carrier protein] reductase
MIKRILGCAGPLSFVVRRPFFRYYDRRLRAFMKLPLEKKLALVTGSSRGIGASIVRRLAEDGADVLIHYNSGLERAEAIVREIKEAGGDADLVGADLSRRDGPQSLLSGLDRAFGGRYSGRLDILVNNAGRFEFGPLADATDESFDSLFDLNVRAVFQLSREAARRMSGAGWGRIINIGSVFGEASTSPGMGIYCGTKFAVQGLTRAWSRDLGAMGVTVNNVQPAVIQPEPSPTSGPTFEAMKRFTSLGRFGKFAEVAEMVALLAGPNAAFVNGASFNVDGGWGA